MKAKIIFSVITLFILSACVKESFTNPHNDNIGDLSVTIIGNSMWGFSNKNSRAATISQIPENGQIKFYSKGGITADGDILTLENGQWTGLKNDKWDTNGNDASIAAYYPVINNITDLYSENGELQDMVWCNTTAKLGDNVNLSFSHMFAKLVINIESELNDTVKDVKVKIPSKISGIDFYTGKLSFLEGGNADITLAKNTEGKYEIFIPASNDCNISLEITCNKGKKYNSSINNKVYNPGYEYICNVKFNPGIYTTTDFIAFTHLINNYLIYGNEDLIYNEKKLSDFYVMQDGKRVFNLYNDLSFTDEESKLIELIGNRSKEFNDIFNGNNHKLSNITLYEKSNCSVFALFVTTGKDATIKNLILSDCGYKDEIEKDISALSGENKGLIDNCNIINFTYNNIASKSYSCIANTNKGTIINCSISGFNLKYNTSNTGIICIYNNGSIINCRIKSDFTKKPALFSSSIVCIYNHKNIFNVFIEDYEKDLYGLCYNNSNTGQYYNCIMPQLYKDNKKHIGTDNAPSSLLKGISFYQDTAEEYQTAANTLNKWIEGEGKEQYPTLTFRRWTTDPIQKVIFE